MKKEERLLQEIIFVNSRKKFQLKDMMAAFSISKNTALRDLSALENLGIPFYSEKGCAGGYTVLDNKIFPPIFFSYNELCAIFFSLQALKVTKQNPFFKTYDSVKAKLLENLSDKQKQQVAQIDQVIQLKGNTNIPAVDHLDQLFMYIMKQQVLSISYTRYEKDTRLIQPLVLQHNYSRWYCFVWDFQKSGFRSFRCDQITDIQLSDTSPISFSQIEIDKLYKEQKKKMRSFCFKAKVAKGYQTRIKESLYDGVFLEQEENQFYLKGYFSEKEIPFLLNYFVTHGKQLKIVSPDFLKIKYQEYLLDLLNHLQS